MVVANDELSKVTEYVVCAVCYLVVCT